MSSNQNVLGTGDGFAICLPKCIYVSEYVTLISGRPSGDAPGYMKLPAHYIDVCLVNSFRALGYKVPYTSSGPFWAIKDGNRFLAPWSTLACYR